MTFNQTNQNTGNVNTTVGNIGLTGAEKAVLIYLAKAADTFCALPDQHPSDVPDFVLAIHALQNIVAFRVARRADPTEWWQPE